MAQQTANLGHYVDRTFINPITAPFSDALAATAAVLTDPRTHRLIVRALILGAVSVTALVLALGGYASFWWVYVPERGLRREVWLQYGDGRPPYALVDLPPAGDFVATDQSYDVTLDLTVPSSERNMDLGNFMVRLTFLSAPPSNATLHAVSRPASLSYHSPLTRSLLTFTHLPSLLSYSSSQVQTLAVPFMVKKILQTSGSRRSGRIAAALVEVGRRDAYPPFDAVGGGGFPVTRGVGELQVYSAVLRFDAHFEGLRWLMYHHPIFSFLFFTSSFLAAEMTVAVFVWALIAYNRGSTSPFERHHLPPSFSSSRLSSSQPSGSSSGVQRISEEEVRLRQRRRKEREREEAARRRIQEADRQLEEESRRRAFDAEASRGRRGMQDVDDLEEEEELEGGGTFEEEEAEVKREPPIIEQSIKEEDEGEGEEELVGGSETTGSGTSRSALESRTTTETTTTGTAASGSTARGESAGARPTVSREPSMRDVDEPSTAEATEEDA